MSKVNNNNNIGRVNFRRKTHVSCRCIIIVALPYFTILLGCLLAIRIYQSTTASKVNNIEGRIRLIDALENYDARRDGLYPPGFWINAKGRSMLDIGANNGDDYTLAGARGGYTVISFEPSESVQRLFLEVMRNASVRTTLCTIDDTDTDSEKSITCNKNDNMNADAQVYLYPVGLSNNTGVSYYHDSSCRTGMKGCGKTNHMLSSDDDRTGSDIKKIHVFRLDDLHLHLIGSVWFMKIDAEGHELEVVQGARRTIANADVQFIAVEFSSNRRTGIDWGVDLLNELDAQGFDCFHLRGFGKCHNASVRPATKQCNFPFDSGAAVGFAEYTAVFAVREEDDVVTESERLSMSDLMCSRR